MTAQTIADTNSYLSFKLDDELFSANVAKVLEILEMTKITKVPQVPNYMRGIINLRGQVLPVIDTKVKFGIPKSEETANTCIVVVEMVLEEKKLQVGILVDSVEEVFVLDYEKILPLPSIGSKFQADFITGMAKSDDNFIMILNIDKILSLDEKETLMHHAK